MGKNKRKDKKRRKLSTEDLVVDILSVDNVTLQVVDDYFNRKFHYSTQTNENLSDVDLNCSSVWEDDGLQDIKRYLNEAKNKLSTFDIKVWHAHTQAMHRGGEIVPFVKKHIRPELCTQAWCKLHEILCSFPHLVKLENKTFNTFHLCEAPGAFVASLNHYLASRNYKGRWSWKASTLNPMYEENNLLFMIDVDDFIQETNEHWCFGADDTGDITVFENIEHLRKVCYDSGMAEIHLVTCDGSIDCANNPGDQEAIVYKLHLCEIITAISLLSEGGSMVLKVFTMFESTSVSFMYLLSVLFKQLSVHKPVTSKPGNSELYVIGSNFQGISQEFLQKLKYEIKSGEYSRSTQLFPQNVISNSFFTDHKNCCKKFAEWQRATIMANLSSFSKKRENLEGSHGSDDDDNDAQCSGSLRHVQHCFVSWYCNLCNLSSIDVSQHIVTNKLSPFSSRRHLVMENGSKYRHKGTLLERKAKLESDAFDKLSSIEKFDVNGLDLYIPCEYYPLYVDLIKMKPVYGRTLKCIKSSKFANKNVLSNFLEFIECEMIMNSKEKNFSLKLDVNIFSDIQEAEHYIYFYSSDEQITNDIKVYYNQKNDKKIILTADANKIACDPKELLRIECLSKLSNHDMDNIVIEESFIHSLFSLIMNLSTNSSLLLLMGCPLTRNLAQIYRVLTASFQKVEVYLSGQLPYIHVMCSHILQINQDLFFYLNGLKSTNHYGKPNEGNYSVLSFLTLLQLYDSNVFDTLHVINDTFMKSRINHFIDLLNKQT